MPIRTGGTAPYAPPATVLQVINAFRDRGLSTPITLDVLMRASVSESLAPRTLASLKGLELLDNEGNPTAELEGLRRATSDEFRQRLAALVRNVYAEVFKFADPATDPPHKIIDAFRAYDPAAQRARMVALFMGLSQAAGLAPEKKPQATSTNGAATPRKKPSATAVKRTVSPAAAARGLAAWPEIGAGAIPPALAGLLASLPAVDEGWSKIQRDKWVQTFEMVLDFAIPIREPETATITDDSDDEE